MSLVLNVEILGEFKNLTAATKGAQSQLQQMNARAASVSRGIRNSLAAIGIGFSLRTVINGIQESVQAASNLEQQFGALDSVFKNLSPSMQTFSRTLSPIGLSAADASKAMALLGSQLKGYGLPVDEAAKKTKSLTLLAADLAATFGGTTLDAVQSISAVFRGEFDPIEKYGVAIKKSDINARMAAEGLTGLTGAALKQAEAQTALTLLFEKTTDAQGQANRESESYAAQMAFLNAEFENTKAELGEALIPLFIEFAQEVRNNLPQIKELVAGFIQFVKFAGEAALWVTRNKDWLVPMVLAIGTVTTAFKVAEAAAKAFQLAALLGIGAGAAATGGVVAGVAGGAAIGGFMEGQQRGKTAQIYGEGFTKLKQDFNKPKGGQTINVNVKTVNDAKTTIKSLSQFEKSTGLTLGQALRQ
jgi:hypothetical protein